MAICKTLLINRREMIFFFWSGNKGAGFLQNRPQDESVYKNRSKSDFLLGRVLQIAKQNASVDKFPLKFLQPLLPP